MKKYAFLLLIGVLLANTSAMAAEPDMADYTTFPVFTNQSVPPNVMVILDNSGSMNWNAYGTWLWSGATVTDQPYAGEPYGGTITVQITSGMDDVEETDTPLAVLNSGSGDLDMGGYSIGSSPTYMGLRFSGIEIPQGATVQYADIDFVAYRDLDTPTDLIIEGEDSGNANVFDQNVTDNVKGRVPVGGAATPLQVAWTPDEWFTGLNYQTPDISTIVQQIVNRPDWMSGNAMMLRIFGTGKRDARGREYGSSSAPRLRIQFAGADPIRYYGLFNPDGFYVYDNGRFELAYKKTSFDTGANQWNVKDMNGISSTLDSAGIVGGGLWDGNWLNWISMRRIDVLRKVLFGGDTANNGASGRDGSGVQTLYSEYDGSNWYRWFDSRGVIAVNPYHDNNYSYRMLYGQIRVDNAEYNIRVEKKEAQEPQDFLNHNLAGIIQKIGDRARWGNIWFRSGSGSGNHGGYLDNAIGTDLTELVNDLEAKDPSSWTPLAETFYIAMQYFRQDVPEIGGFTSGLNGTKEDEDDPYFREGEPVPCAKSFVILLTDGASTKDANIPTAYKDQDGDGDRQSCDEAAETNCDYPDGGTDYLDDLALYAHTTDLRPDIEDNQTVTLYTIYAFGNDDDARNLLRDAARNGGFEDRDGDNLPDGVYTDLNPEDRVEWDEDGDFQPDTYFEANDGYTLEARLVEAFGDILKRTSSGTAASVLATNSVGAGNAVQAYFRPFSQIGLERARWLGFLESLWVDPWGNLREDTNGNMKLDLRNNGNQNVAEDGVVDRIVEFVTINNDTVAKIYTSHYLYNKENGDNGNCRLGEDNCDLVSEFFPMDAVTPIFESGQNLAERDLGNNPRSIFTYIGKLDAPNTDTARDTGGEVILFDTGMEAELKPFFAMADSLNTGRWDAYGTSENDRATNLISYIQGNDSIGLRNRTLAGTTWRLGDIVHSTPIVVSRPAEQFHLLYKDRRYFEFLHEFQDRETMIYVGGNDGMLHAFTNWQYVEDEDGNASYEKPAGAAAGEQIGDELWAYVPQSVLPHLKWLGLNDYTHTYLMDGEPRVFDADILPNGTHYNGNGNNFGTFLVMGLGMGGKQIDLNADLDGDGNDDVMSPTYVLMDITKPREPRLMWERTYTNLGMSLSVPAPVRVNGKWFLVFGSGPTEYDGFSDHGGYIYVVDMLTGEPYGAGADWLYGELEGEDGIAYFNDPLALDIFQSANADAIYLAKNYYEDNNWKSDVLKVTVPCSTDHCPWDAPDQADISYSGDPSEWDLSTLFAGDRPVSVKLTSSQDPLGNVFLYFGTGRYLSESDKLSIEQQYFYGIKDPFYNLALYENSFYRDFSQEKTLTRTDLFDSNDVEVTTEGYVTGLTGDDQEFFEFLQEMRIKEDGWYLSLKTNDPAPAERIITRPAVLGGIVLTPTFTPNARICGLGGDTELLGVYYETGTGFTEQIFDIENPEKTSITIKHEDGSTSTEDQDVVAIRDDRLLKGTPAPKIVFHIGLEDGATSKLQMSSRGEGGGFTNPVMEFRSTITEWWDQQ